MSENDTTATLPPEQPVAPKERRTLGLPVVGAIAVATLLIGGLAGGIIGYAVHSDDSRGGRPDFTPGQGFQGGPGGRGSMPQPPSGQAPDTQDQDDSGSDS